MFKKKEKAELEPQYYMSATHMPAYNYKVYYMSKKEKILYFLLAFAVGAIVGYLFYGGIGKDEFGNPTIITYVIDVLIPGSLGYIAGKAFIPIRTKQICNKNRKKLRSQFRGMLDGITTALGAGNNVVNSFNSVYNDLKNQYDEEDFIIKELEIILSGMNSNFNIEDLLMDFGERSGIDDIKSFANVFQISYRKGGNVKDVIQSTHSILTEKISIEEEIETTISGSKLDQSIMIVLPIGIVGMMKVMSPEFSSNFVSGVGIISTTIAVGMFVLSYFIGKSIMSIKV